MLKAIQKYDPARGCDFVAFAIPSIVGEIKNYFRDHGWAVKVPRKLQKQRLAVGRSVQHLNQSLGRSPTIPEIVEATGFSEEEVYDTFEVEKYGKPASLDAEYNGDGNKDGTSLLDYLGDVDPQFEEMIDRLDLINAIKCLSKQEKTIIYLKFYSSLSQAKIGDLLGISQMHVSRLQRNALSKLKLNLA